MKITKSRKVVTKPTPHNPDGVTAKQLNPTKRGKPWRFLDRNEVRKRAKTQQLQMWCIDQFMKEFPCHGDSKCITYRTRLTRAELAKLTAGTQGGGK